MLRHDLLPEAAWEMSPSLQGGVWPPAALLAVVGALPGMARTSIPSPWPFLSFSLPSACHHHPRTSALWLPQAFRPCFLHFLILAAPLLPVPPLLQGCLGTHPALGPHVPGRAQPFLALQRGAGHCPNSSLHLLCLSPIPCLHAPR